MLLLWKQRNGKKATYRIMSEALVRASRSDLADNLRGYEGKIGIISKAYLDKVKFGRCSILWTLPIEM